MWTQTRLTALLGIDLPIVQGPFGGGYSTPALAAAVSNAGALGSLGAANLGPDEILAVVRDIAGRTARPFNINLWVPIAGEDDAVVERSRFERTAARIAPFLEAAGLPVPTFPLPKAIAFEAQVEALLAACPPVFSFVMGVPDRAILEAARGRGIKTIGTATTVDEAVAIEAAGADAVVASGSDAGGHRGSFLRPVEASLVGTFSLVPQMAKAVRIPVIAAGGVATGAGVAAALTLGADAVQIGTAFLAAPESGAPAVHKALLGTEGARWTRLTRVFSGRFARGIENALMNALSSDDALPYPMHNALMMPLRRAAAKEGKLDWLALWAGQNAASARRLPAAEIVRLLAEETDDVLAADRLRPRSVG